MQYNWPSLKLSLFISNSFLTLDFLIYFLRQVALSFHIPNGNWNQSQLICSNMNTDLDREGYLPGVIFREYGLGWSLTPKALHQYVWMSSFIIMLSVIVIRTSCWTCLVSCRLINLQLNFKWLCQWCMWPCLISYCAVPGYWVSRHNLTRQTCSMGICIALISWAKWNIK